MIVIKVSGLRLTFVAWSPRLILCLVTSLTEFKLLKLRGKKWIDARVCGGGGSYGAVVMLVVGKLYRCSYLKAHLKLAFHFLGLFSLPSYFPE